MPVKIFFCYAHKDESLLNTLKIHLRPLQRQGLIELWYDREISAGAEWEQEISQHLNAAQIILLLISPDFMASDYIHDIELKRAIERHKNKEARVIPVILRPSHWKEAMLGQLQALPTDAKPVMSWSKRDEAFFNVAEGIHKAAEQLTAQIPATLSDNSHQSPAQNRMDSFTPTKSVSEWPSQAHQEIKPESDEGLQAKHVQQLSGEPRQTKQTGPVLDVAQPPPVRSPQSATRPSTQNLLIKRPSTIALLIVLVLLTIGSVILLRPSIPNKAAEGNVTATATVQTYDRFVAANGMMFGFDAAHTRFNPYERILTRSDVSRLTQAWTSLKEGFFFSPPAVVNGMVYIGSGDHLLYAFKADGCGQSICSPVWTAATGGAVFSSPVVVNGVVYVGSDDGSLYALDANTGHVRWQFSAGSSIISSPAVVNGVVYVGSDDWKLYAVDANTGNLVWNFDTGGSIQSSPAVVNGMVYVGSNDHWLYAVNASTHKKLWSFHTGGPIKSSPEVANGVVYVGSEDGLLYAVDANTGSPLWSFHTGGPIDSSPAVVNGMVYVGSIDGKVYAFDLK